MSNTNTPLLSIIIPIYNVASYLKQCIESIINQKGNIEVILIDDGSPDASPSICDEYALNDNRIHVIHKQNGGVSSARNAGLDAAKGEWIWFVDGDDYIVDYAIKELENIIKNNKNTDLIRFSYQRLQDNHITKINIENIKNLTKNVYLQNQHSYLNPTMLFKRELINDITLRFSEDIKMGEDLEFQYKYLLHCNHPIQYNKHLYIYRLRESSATKSNDSRYKIVNDSLTVLSNLLSFVNQQKITPEPWFYIKIQNIMKNVLFSASLVKDIDLKALQNRIRNIMNLYSKYNIDCFNTVKMKLAYLNIKLYFALNYIYLKLTGNYKL